MTSVGDLFISLGIKPTGFAAVNRSMSGLLASVGRFAVGAAAYLGVRGLGRSMIGLNSSIADAKNQIGAVLALSRGTGLNDQLGDANKLYDGLRAKAAELPGTTKEYVDMLTMLAHPMARAKLSTEQMIDLTTGAMTSSRGLNENWAKTARDIREFINFGKMNAVDTFARLMLPDFDSDAGKKQLKAMTVSQRATLMAARVNQKAMKDLQAAQSQSFSGRVDKLKDTAQLFLARAGEKLFVKLGDSIRRATKWLDENKAAVQAVADSIGGALATAFDLVGSAIGFLLEHGDATKAVLVGIAGAFFLIGIRAAGAWLLALGPLVPLIAIITGAFYLFTRLRDSIGDVGAAIVAAFAATAVWKTVAAVKTLVTWMWGLKAATAGTGVAGAVGAAGAVTRSSALAAAGAAAVPGAAGAGAFAAGAGARGAGAAGAVGTAAKAGGGLLQGVPYIGAAIAVTDVLDRVIPEGTAGEILKWFATGPVALPKYALGKLADSGAFSSIWDNPAMMEAMGMGAASANVPGGTNTNTTNITVAVAPANINISTADAKGAAEQFAQANEERYAASLRAAQRATGGNR